MAGRRMLVNGGIIVAIGVAVAVVAWAPLKGQKPMVTVYKSVTCGCCNKWIDHLEENGFSVEAHDVDDMAAVKAQHGVGEQLQSCHTAVVEGYVIEGHVPASSIRRLLVERRDVAGLAVPGMPIGSPGMEIPGEPAEPYDVLALAEDGTTSVYEQR